MEVLKALKNMKRFLVTLLTVAMVIGSVPSVAFGAEDLGSKEPDANTETEIEEAAEESVVDEPLNSADDMSVWFSHVDDLLGDQGLVLYDLAELKRDEGATYFVDGGWRSPYEGNPGKMVSANSAASYSFVVEPVSGLKFKDDAKVLKSISFNKFTSETDTGTLVTVGTDKNDNKYWTITDIDSDEQLREDVGPFLNEGSKLVTLTAKTMAEAFEAGKLAGTSKLEVAKVVTVDFDTENTEAAKIPVPIRAADDKVQVKDNAAAEFKRSLDKDAQVSLSENVVDFGKYNVSANGSKFLTVIVKDEEGQVIDDYTKQGCAAGTSTDKKKVITISSNGDYDTYCVGGGNGFNLVDELDDLKNNRWVAYVANTCTTGASTGDTLYVGNVIISASALQEIFYAGYSVEILVSGEEAIQGDVAVVYTDDKKDGFVTYTLNGTAGSKAPVTVAKGANLEFNVVPVTTDHANRKVFNVWYKIDDGDWTLADYFSDGAGGNVSFTVPNVDMKKISIKTDATENLTVLGDGRGKVTVYSLDGEELPVDSASANDPAQRAIDGAPYKFIVVAKDRYTVNRVDVNMNTGEGKQKVDPENNIYTTPADVTDALDIYVANGETDGTTYYASVNSDAPVFATVRALDDLNTKIPTSNTQKLAEKGKPFYFTISQNKADGLIDSVSCKVGDGTSETLSPIATKKDDATGINTYFYVTNGAAGTGIDGNVSITVSGSATGNVRGIFAANNDKAKFSFAKPGVSANASEGTAFKFTVEPANLETTTITEVGYYLATKALTHSVSEFHAGAGINKVLGTKAGEYSFTVPSENQDVVVYAVTEEKVAADTYRVEFKDAKKDRVSSQFTTDDASKQNINTLKSQSLDLVLTTGESDLGDTKVYLKDKISGKFVNSMNFQTASSNGIHPSLTFELENETNTVKISNKVSGDDKQAYVITPHVVGEDTLKGKFVVDEGGNRGELNRLAYTADLPVNVKDLFSNLQISASTESFYPYKGATADEIATLKIVGMDSQTGEPTELKVDGADIKEVVWSFDPSIESIPLSDRNYGFGTSYADTVKNDHVGYTASANVIAKKASENIIQVKATVTFGKNYKSLPDKVVGPITLKCVKKPDYRYFSVTKTSGARVSGNYIDTRNYGDGATANGKIVLGLADNDEKSVYVDYDVYQVLDEDGFGKVTNGGFVRGTTTVAQLAEALDKGYIKDATRSVTFSGATVKLFKGSEEVKNVADYVTFEGEDGIYTVTGKKKTDDVYYVKVMAPVMTVNGVAVASLNPADADRHDQVKVKVIDRQPKHKVDLVLYDSIEKEVGSKKTYEITEHKVNADYIASRPNDEVKSLNTKNKEDNAWTYDKVTGIRFTQVPQNSSFVLPTAEDFATSTSGNRILVGWQKYATVDDGVAKTEQAEYFKPGDADDIPNSDVVYKAIWADKYGISDITNGNMVTIGKDDYDETITNQKQYKTPLSGNMVKGGVIPVVLRVSEAYSVETDVNKIEGDNTDAKNAIKLKSKYITTGFTVTAKKNGDAIEIGQDAGGRPTITGKKLLTSDGAVITASWDSDKGTITADSGKIFVKEAGTFKVELAKKEISVEEGQDPTTAVVNAVLTVDKDGTDVKVPTGEAWNTGSPYRDPKNYSLTWSNASEAEAEYATAQTSFDKDSTKTTEKHINYISGLKATTEPVTLTLTAANIYGQTATATLKVTVNSAKVGFKVYKNNAAKDEI